MADFSYLERRTRLKTYFDRTAVDAWARLTTDAPVSGIRATVRQGRDEMRSTLLSWLPSEMHGQSLLDAGCGTGLLAVDAARRGATVTAIDLSPTLIGLARERTPRDLGVGRIDYHAGDMLDPPRPSERAGGRFDYTVAMDSLIHYQASDIIGALARLAPMTRRAILFTVAPRTPMLTVMHTVGRVFPKGDRAPEIEPISPEHLSRLAAAEPRLANFRLVERRRISRGFYISEALRFVRSGGGTQ
ncbi:MAG: magnesium protoporphyrin IX methyltransferase [Hyphomicrobiaceae bacterium]|nr:magnesium protoporphyrin IX methyltransferase [Hyphomicrobiaceae bacterium]